MKLHEGQMAPDFSLPDQNGAIHKLSDYRGKWVVLYFYPNDDTPGCTTEACTFSDNLPHFDTINATILGVSVDSVMSHKEFSDKYNLPFTLLADETEKVVGLYGVWKEKENHGQKKMGTERTTFLINPSGEVVKIYEKVNPDAHAEAVINDLRVIQ